MRLWMPKQSSVLMIGKCNSPWSLAVLCLNTSINTRAGNDVALIDALTSDCLFLQSHCNFTVHLRNTFGTYVQMTRCRDVVRNQEDRDRALFAKVSPTKLCPSMHSECVDPFPFPSIAGRALRRLEVRRMALCSLCTAPESPCPHCPVSLDVVLPAGQPTPQDI